MTYWGVVLTDEGDKSWAEGPLLDAGGAPFSPKGVSVASEVELARVPPSLARNMNLEVVAYGPGGEICRASLTQPKLVVAHGGWLETLPGLENAALADPPDSADARQTRNRRIRQAIWDDVTQPWLVSGLAPLPGHASCDGAMLVVDATLHSHAAPTAEREVSDPIVAKVIADFLGSPQLRKEKAKFGKWRKERMAACAREREAGEPRTTIPTWEALLSRSLRVRSYGQHEAPDVIAVQLTNDPEDYCGDEWWHSSANAYMRKADGNYALLYAGYPDVLVNLEGQWLDASRLDETSGGTELIFDAGGDEFRMAAMWP